MAAAIAAPALAFKRSTRERCPKCCGCTVHQGCRQSPASGRFAMLICSPLILASLCSYAVSRHALLRLSPSPLVQANDRKFESRDHGHVVAPERNVAQVKLLPSRYHLAAQLRRFTRSIGSFGGFLQLIASSHHAMNSPDHAASTSPHAFTASKA